MRFGDMRDHGLIVKAVRQSAHHDGRSITLVVRVALDISRQPQRFQNPVSGGARQPDRGGQGIDGAPAPSDSVPSIRRARGSGRGSAGSIHVGCRLASGNELTFACMTAFLKDISFEKTTTYATRRPNPCARGAAQVDAAMRAAGAKFGATLVHKYRKDQIWLPGSGYNLRPYLERKFKEPGLSCRKNP